MQTSTPPHPVKTVPLQLQNNAFRFVKLLPGTKKPFEKDWQNLHYSYKDVEGWLDQGFNYGVMGGHGNNVIIDEDCPEVGVAIRKHLPPTYTVKSRKGYHHYYHCSGIPRKIVLQVGKDHYGEIISGGSQVVGPGSIHPDTGEPYVVVNDAPIVEVSAQDIFSALAGFFPVEFPKPDPAVEIGNISIMDVVAKYGIDLKKVGGQLVGSHPVHGSTNHNNFVVSPEKNCFFCFRHHIGGGPLLLIAILDGIISCEGATPGALCGEKFIEVIKIANEKLGLNISLNSPTSSATNTVVSDDKLTALETKVAAIPKETSPVRLPALLDPILKEIAMINIAQGEAFLKHVIKERFNLTNDDLKSYEKVLKAYRKDPKDAPVKQSLSKAELIEILHEDEGNKTIHPAQDYCDGVMVFAVKVKDTMYLLTSDRRMFLLSEAASNGFILKNDTVDTARFSPQGISIFLNDKYPLNIPALFQKIFDYIHRFICFPDETYLIFLTLWIMGTYVFMLFRYFPYVWLNAEKGSGKTLLMEIISVIAFNGDLITNPTESVIFRDIANNLVSMFIDEVEQLRKRDKDVYGSLISILNAGFNKSGSVKRTASTVQGQFFVIAFTVYACKMFAGINELDDVLGDRTVRIPLLRKRDDEWVDRYKASDEILELQRSIRDDLYVFALLYAKEISAYYHATGADAIEGLAHLNNRELDIWEPIFLLANIVDAQRGTTELTTAMEALSKKSLAEKQSANVSENETYKILSVLKSMLDELKPVSDDGNVRVYEADRVLDYFKANEDFDWIQKTNVLTRRLKKVKVASDQRRFDGEKKRIYLVNVREFTDLCERFKI